MSSPATDGWSAAQVVKNSGASSNSGSPSMARWTRWRISAVSVVVGAGECDRGLERALQAVVTDVADEQRPAGGQHIHGIVDEVGQISRVGEVLDDRVEDDGVEVALRQCLGDVGGLGQQLDPITPRDAQLLQRAGEVVDGHRRHVGGDDSVHTAGRSVTTPAPSPRRSPTLAAAAGP